MERDSPVQTLVNTVAGKPAVLPLTSSLLGNIRSVLGISGMTLTNPMGELLYSTIEDEQINEFIAFLSGVMPALEEAAALGVIHHILLKSPQDSNLSLFVRNGQSLGLLSRPKASLHGIAQQVESLLQQP
jgi:uncharacterized protein